MRFLAFAIALQASIVAAATAHGQTAPSIGDIYNENQQSVVRIKVTGTKALGTATEHYGTAFIVSNNGYLVTAAHNVGEDEDWKREPGSGRLLRTIRVEGLNDNEHLTLVSSSAGVARFAPDVDLAVLRISGRNHTPVKCSASLVSDFVDVAMIGFASENDYLDILRGNVSPGPVMAGDRRRLRLPASKGHSGSPVFGRDGSVMGVIVSGVHGAVAPQGEAYMVPMGYALSLLPYGQVSCLPSAETANAPGDSAVVEAPGGGQLAVKQVDLGCVEQRVNEFRTKVFFEERDRVRCDGGGIHAKSDRQEKTFRYQAMSGFEILGPVRVESNGNTNLGGHYAPDYESNGDGRTVAVSVNFYCRSPAQLFGPGDWRNLIVRGQTRRILTSEDEARFRQECMS